MVGAGRKEADTVFGLPHGVFAPLGSPAKRDYAQVVLHLYRSSLSANMLDGLDLRRADMIGFLANAIAARVPSPFAHDAHNTAISEDPAVVYRNLVDAGWFVERTVGSQTLVLILRQVMELMRALDVIERGASVNFTGSLQTMEVALRALGENPSERAMMLAVAAQQAEDFMGKMIAVNSDIHANENSIVQLSGFGEMMAAFFDDFVAHLISDYRAMKSRYNPLRYASSIMSIAGHYADDDAIVAELARGYVACGYAVDETVGEANVRAHLEVVQGVFGRAQGMVDEIDDIRLRVEERIARAVRFVDAAAAAQAQEIEELLRLLGEVADVVEDGGLPPSLFMLDDAPVDPGSMASPRRRQPQVESVGVAVVGHDGEMALLAREQMRYAEALIPTARSIEEYVERHLGTAASLPLSAFAIAEPREMLLLAAVRSAGANTDAAVRERYGVTFAGGLVDGAWSDYAEGVVYRIGSAADPLVADGVPVDPDIAPLAAPEEIA